MHHTEVDWPLRTMLLGTDHLACDLHGALSEPDVRLRD